jgi:catalase
MELNYMKKEDFGKVPAYLAQVKEEIKRENQMIERYVKEQMGEVEEAPEVFEEFSEEERMALVDALKAKWDSVNAQYQKITHLVKLDTTGQLRRKETLEAQLTKLENDIQRLDRPGAVMIRNA